MAEQRFRDTEFDVSTSQRRSMRTGSLSWCHPSTVTPGGKVDLRHLLWLYCDGRASIGFVLDTLDKAVAAREVALLDKALKAMPIFRLSEEHGRGIDRCRAVVKELRDEIRRQ